MQQRQQQTSVIFSVCAPSDIQGLEQWETHLHPLEQAGVLSVWSVRHLQPGMDRLKLLQDHLDQADLIVLLLSADFFSDDECILLMERALARHQQGSVQVIPLLLRPVSWRETKLATFAPLPSDSRPVTLWGNPESAFNDCVRDLRRILGRSVTAPLRQKPERVSGEERNRERMLQRLRRSYGDLFAQSLQGVTQLELGLSNKPDAIQNAATLLFQTGTRPEQLLPPGISILHVYDEAAHELLILGAPGSGKSTLLVELAQQLVVRAETDDTHPLPVILPLSSWAVKRPRLEIWLVEQVAQIYGIPKKVARLWIDEDQLLLLLDGLDEMDEAACQDCIAAINTYHRDHLHTLLVVCSRQAEYEEASKSQRLTLQSAVVVQPLAHEQVQAYLKQAGKPLAALRRIFSTNQALVEVATTPLMVHILILTYRSTSVRQLSTQRGQLEQQVWTDYVQRMMERKNARQYSLSQTRSWLGWLAREMYLHNQTIFYGERLQADCLPDRLLQVFTWLAKQIPAMIIGVLANLLGWLFLGNSYDLTTLFQVGFVGAFLGGWLNRLPRQSTVSPASPPSTKKRSSRILVAYLGSSLALGAFFGISFGFDVNGNLYSLGDWLHDGILSAIGIGLCGWMMLWLLFRISQRASPSTRHRFLLSHRLNNIHLRRAAVIALIWGTAYWLSLVSSKGLWYGLSVGLTFGLIFGFTGFLLSFILENRGGMFRLADRLHWNAQYLIRPGHLRDSLLFAGLLSLIFALNYWLKYGQTDGLHHDRLNHGLIIALSIALTYGLGYWLLFGLFQGIVQEQVEDQDRRTFNQGIRCSLHNGFLVCLLSGGIIPGIYLLSGWLRFGLIDGWNNGLKFVLVYGLSYSPFLALSGGLLVWAIVGGLTVFQHYVMRFLLARSRAFPWRAQAFLDNAVDSILLQHVGGGYSFVHRLLLIYFVNLYTKPTPTPVTENSPLANNPSV